jgi:hypothetical protein
MSGPTGTTCVSTFAPAAVNCSAAVAACSRLFTCSNTGTGARSTNLAASGAVSSGPHREDGFDDVGEVGALAGEHDVEDRAPLLDLLGVTGGATEGTINLEPALGRSRPGLGINLGGVDNIGGELRPTDLQLGLNNQPEPRGCQGEKHPKEYERTLIHRRPSIGIGVGASSAAAGALNVQQ